MNPNRHINCWNKNYKLVREYVEDKGTFPLSNAVYKCEYVGKFLYKEIQKYKNGVLDERKKALFEAIGFNFQDIKSNFVTKGDIQWAKTYDLLILYMAMIGKPPIEYTVFHDIKIGKWFSQQRHLDKKGKLKKDRREKLKYLNLLGTK
jgi:hypothetical protein